MTANKKSIGLLILISLISSLFLTAQDKRDMVRFQMPNGATVENRLFYKEKEDLAKQSEIQDLLADFLKRWDVLGIEELDQTQAYKISCSTQNEYYKNKLHNIFIEEIMSKKQVSFPTDSAIVLVIEGQNQLELNKNWKIYFSNIDQLKHISTFNWKNLLKSTEKQLLQDSQWIVKQRSFSSWVKIKDDESVELLDQTQNPNIPKQTDMIIITGGPSLSYLKDSWNTGFHLDLGLKLSNKNTYKDFINFSYEWMYDFSGEKKVNHWLDIKYARNISKDSNKANWLGASFGFLAKRNGDQFKKGTYRIGIDKKLNDNISITPQLYFNDFFKDVYPGIKLKIQL